MGTPGWAAVAGVVVLALVVSVVDGRARLGPRRRSRPRGGGGEHGGGGDGPRGR